MCCGLFFFNDTATTEIYPLSLHDALPIYSVAAGRDPAAVRIDLPPARRDRFGVDGGDDALCAVACGRLFDERRIVHADRKSTRLNSSHSQISYAVFCLEKKNDHTDIGWYS